MEVIGKWNKISEKLKSEIPQLKPGQHIAVRMLNGAPNIAASEHERKQTPLKYPRTNINLKDRIWDPYQGRTNAKGEFLGEWVDIGIWNSVDKNGNPEGWIQFRPWENKEPFNGKFDLIEGRDRENEFFEFFWLSNDRKDNPNRRSNVDPLFEIIDPVKEGKQTTKKANDLLSALQIVKDMTAKERKDFAAAMVWSPNLEEDELMGKLNDMAISTPSFITTAFGSPDMRIKAVLGQAIQYELVKFDEASGKVSYSSSDVLIGKIDVPQGKPWIEGFLEWIKKHKDGNKVQAAIKDMLKNFAPAAEEEVA